MASAAIQSYKIKAVGQSQQGEVDKLGGSGEDIHPSHRRGVSGPGGNGDEGQLQGDVHCSTTQRCSRNDGAKHR